MRMPFSMVQTALTLSFRAKRGILLIYCRKKRIPRRRRSSEMTDHGFFCNC